MHKDVTEFAVSNHATNGSALVNPASSLASTQDSLFELARNGMASRTVQIKSPEPGNFQPQVERVLVIDDDPMVLEYLLAVIRQEGYSAEGITDARHFKAWIEELQPDVVITDYRMPFLNGFEVLCQVREFSPQTPVVMLTGHADLDQAVEAMRLGACDYVAKPIQPSRLIASIHVAAKWKSQQEYKRMKEEVSSLRQQVQDLTDDAMHALVAALDAREKETNHHSLRVSRYCSYLAKQLGISGDDLVMIERGALLHDIGKIGIPDSILLKPAALDNEEWRIVRQHPEIGFSIVGDLQWLAGGELIVRHHHERYDGNGYPHQMRGDNIPFGARMFSVIDTLDALTSDRPYRKARPFHVAIAEIQRCSGTQFDPQIVEAFVKIPVEKWNELAAPLNHQIAVAPITLNHLCAKAGGG